MTCYARRQTVQSDDVYIGARARSAPRGAVMMDQSRWRQSAETARRM